MFKDEPKGSTAGRKIIVPAMPVEAPPLPKSRPEHDHEYQQRVWRNYDREQWVGRQLLDEHPAEREVFEEDVIE